MHPMAMIISRPVPLQIRKQKELSISLIHLTIFNFLWRRFYLLLILLCIFNSRWKWLIFLLYPSIYFSCYINCKYKCKITGSCKSHQMFKYQREVKKKLVNLFFLASYPHFSHLSRVGKYPLTDGLIHYCWDRS